MVGNSAINFTGAATLVGNVPAASGLNVLNVSSTATTTLSGVIGESNGARSLSILGAGALSLPTAS